jgi:hypothetical protein
MGSPPFFLDIAMPLKEKAPSENGAKSPIMKDRGLGGTLSKPFRADSGHVEA